MPKQMKLGLFLIPAGHHVAAWRHPEARANAGMDLAHYIDLARHAERGLMDMLFLGDVIGMVPGDQKTARLNRGIRFDPLMLLAALSMATRQIGLVATATTTYNEPYHVARRFAALDHLSGGRAGWNVVTSANPHEARHFGNGSHPARDARYDRAEEFLDVVFGLWDSWEEDALLLDKASGRFFDGAKYHPIAHDGAHFQVHGGLDSPRTPQGYPIVVQAGSSETSKELAARTADVVFTAHARLADAQAFYADLKRRMPRHGRAPDTLRIMPGIMPVVGSSAAEARAKYRVLQELIHPDVGLAMLSQIFTQDLSACDPDGPLPSGEDLNYSRAAMLRQIAAQENLSLRDLWMRAAGARGHVEVFGTAADIADVMEEWVLEGGADGFNIMPAYYPTGLTDFVDLVIPELQRRGIFRTDYEEGTLRDRLGVPKPQSRARRRAA